MSVFLYVDTVLRQCLGSERNAAYVFLTITFPYAITRDLYPLQRADADALSHHEVRVSLTTVELTCPTLTQTASIPHPRSCSRSRSGVSTAAGGT